MSVLLLRSLCAHCDVLFVVFGDADVLIRMCMRCAMICGLLLCDVSSCDVCSVLC